VEFRLNGETLWHFVHPRCTDQTISIFDESNASLYLRSQARNLFVQVRVPWDWLDTAVYPVVIDPTIDDDVASSGDDGSWAEGVSAFSSTDTSIACGSHSVQGDLNLYTRHTASITTGSTVNTSYVTYTAFADNSSSVMRTDIAAVDAASPSAPTTYSEAENATRTTEYVQWDSLGTWTDGSEYDTPSIVDVIQELVDSYSTSYIIIYWEESNSQSNRLRQASAYDHSSAEAAALYIDYTDAAGGVVSQRLLIGTGI
jgi:hypothetical protein